MHPPEIARRCAIPYGSAEPLSSIPATALDDTVVKDSCLCGASPVSNLLAGSGEIARYCMNVSLEMSRGFRSADWVGIPYGAARCSRDTPANGGPSQSM